MYLVELPKGENGFIFKVKCAVIAETDMSISNLICKRKTRLISRRSDILNYIYTKQSCR